MALPALTPVDSPRLRLRPVCGDDLTDLIEENGDDQVTRFLRYTAWQTPEDASSWLARMQALANAGSALQWVVQRRSGAAAQRRQGDRHGAAVQVGRGQGPEVCAGTAAAGR